MFNEHILLVYAISLQYFLKTGACKYGPTCKYHHPKDRNGAGPVLFNVLGFPMRQVRLHSADSLLIITVSSTTFILVRKLYMFLLSPG